MSQGLSTHLSEFVESNSSSSVLGRYQSAFDSIHELSNQIDDLRHIKPVNLEYCFAEFKRAYSRGASLPAPEFAYRDSLPYNPNEFEALLDTMDVPEEVPILSEVLFELKVGARLANELNRSLGNRDRSLERSIALYGIPELELVYKAEKILNQTEQPSPDELPYSALEMKRALEGALQVFGLNSWRVVLSDNPTTTARHIPGEAFGGEITVGKNRMFSQNELLRLPVHEVGVHAVRRHNGQHQPLSILASGLPGYVSTEEGMAAYAERVTGLSTTEVTRKYAARTLAVYSMIHENNFVETLNMLLDYKIPAEDAWMITYRVYRGGGYAKDHVYLEGVTEVEKYMLEGGSISTLYSGKFSLRHLPLIENLIEVGLLQAPEVVPEFFSSTQ